MNLRITVLVLLLLLLYCTKNGVSQSVITIKQDGTGNFTTIQQGIDASGNGDTILVWPGVYQENIIAYQKNFILGSLSLTTGNPAYISQTVIDGNNNGRCMMIYKCVPNPVVHGLTIRNGFAYGLGTHIGGGVFLQESSLVSIINCVLENNRAYGSGGGLYSFLSDTYLKGTTIRNNHSHNSGGGIKRAGGTLIFDSVSRCNIYLNHAAVGTDIQSNYDELDVYVDTFTVAEPDYYYLYGDSSGLAVDFISWDINQGMIQQTNQDLYVAPEGDNTNDGLSPLSPLKTISYALLKMRSDAFSPDTLHLANGTYTLSGEEKYPISLKANVSIVGNERDSVILDAENMTSLFRGIMYADNYLLKNFIAQHGNGDSSCAYNRGAFDIFENRNAGIENVIFRENQGSETSGGRIMNSNGFKVVNAVFQDNTGGDAFRIAYGTPWFQSDTIEVINCQFINNRPDYSIPADEGGGGGACAVFGRSIITEQKSLHANFYNCLFTGNHSRLHPYGGMSSTSIVFIWNSKGIMSNCTFGNNDSDNPLGGNIGITNNSMLDIYNSAMYHNEPAEFYMYTYEDNSYLNIYNSTVEGGENEIRSYTQGNNIFYDPTNIESDPQWDTASMYPYSLSSGSPCIDAGTLDLPPGIVLPETDLVGNPRVYNGYVDMGAYEYGPWVGVPSAEYRVPNDKLLEVYPNPFSYETNISYTIPENGHTTIKVYDMTGCCINTLLDELSFSEKGQIRWQGTDSRGLPVRPGIYVVRLSLNGKEKSAVKVVRQ